MEFAGVCRYYAEQPLKLEGCIWRGKNFCELEYSAELMALFAISSLIYMSVFVHHALWGEFRLWPDADTS